MLSSDIFRQVIAVDFHREADSENILCISEVQLQAKCQWVKIKLKKSVPSFCFTVDFKREKNMGDPVFPFFNVDKFGLCAKNDLILICNKPNKTYVVLIELKSENQGYYLKQLKASKIFVDFVIDRLNLIGNKDEYIDKSQLEYRGVLFNLKQRTTQGITRKNDKKNKINFEERNGLLVAELPCHDTYQLQQFFPNY